MTTEWRERFTHRSRARVHDKRPVSGPRSARFLLAVSQYPGNPGSKDDAVLEDRRAAFCARLKSSRERKGVSLEEIAASTKISRSLLKGLEENDLSRWPQGLY
ncbi:MAG: helix-turn-helix domain-containing protein, partial [Burkholderiales bacterium]